MLRNRCTWPLTDRRDLGGTSFVDLFGGMQLLGHAVSSRVQTVKLNKDNQNKQKQLLFLTIVMSSGSARPQKC